MAKFRANHQRNGGGGFSSKLGIFVVLGGLLFWGFSKFTGEETTLTEAIETVADQVNGKNNNKPRNGGDYEIDRPNDKGDYDKVDYVSDEVFPTRNLGKLVKHKYYGMSYVEAHEQPEWVAYQLTRNHLTSKVKRTNDFRPDPKVRSASASKRDYRGSGYDRGHLVPAGDMTFNRDAMSETFYMSNMSPQIRNFNGGIWRELEESVRYWTKKFGHLYVVTGPVLTEGIREKIGGNEVSVPDAYYKVLLYFTDTEKKAIGFLLPNEVSVDPLNAYAVPVDEIEKITGLDFFSDVIKDKNLESKLESSYNIRDWSFSKKQFRKRVDQWNKR